MSWLGAFNYFVTQWFFFRIARVIEHGEIAGAGILFPVVPLTGWTTDYKPTMPCYWPIFWL